MMLPRSLHSCSDKVGRCSQRVSSQQLFQLCFITSASCSPTPFLSREKMKKEKCFGAFCFGLHFGKVFSKYPINTKSYGIVCVVSFKARFSVCFFLSFLSFSFFLSFSLPSFECTPSECEGDHPLAPHHPTPPW